MSKYQNLSKHLLSLTVHEWTASFREIEKILGRPLPESARTYPAWWSNQTGGGHSQSAAWQAVGWKTVGLDLEGECVTFLRRNLVMVGQETPQETDNRNGEQAKPIALTIAEAKRGLAAHFGVSPESVEIIIKG